MALKKVLLDNFRLPGHADAVLHLDGAPLCVADIEAFDKNTDSSELTAAIGIATVLHNWCPDALAAFLDLDAWFSFTWSLAIQQGEADETNIEIGRIGNQLTFGTLDKDGDNWTLMLTYNISLEGPDRGAWVPNPKESMKGDDDITEPNEIDKLSRAFARDIILEKRWNTGKKLRHKFHIEYAPMDVWGDGIPMNPHWLYKSLNLSECTVCGKEASLGSPLQRCGRCGTATDCSSECQRNDWAVHKHICSLGLEDRGQMLAITEKGGLINWDPDRTYASADSKEESKNSNFAEPQLKRCKHSTGNFVKKEAE
ncbi:MYND-type zinc finger protein samB [Parastagonospora nodorum]|nr:MYND-type zinc finger protein samB [Parastagonospora nodorum]